MATAPQPQIDDAHSACHALAAALPPGDEPPEWIDIFPQAGKITTRDKRSYIVDADALVARFNADGVQIPLDINHATAFAAKDGREAPAVSWITQLRAVGGKLQGKVDWLAKGREALAARSYKFVSPDFFHTPDGRTTWLRSVALVTAPALAHQTALAAANANEESKMKDLAAALGVTTDASEQSMLAALSAGFVPKDVHAETLRKLEEKTAQLATIETQARKSKVDALLDGALKDKKIVPAQRAQYEALCATDAGYDNVCALLAAQKTVLPGSGLDEKKAPEGGVDLTAAQLAAKAHKMVENGEAADFLSAVNALSEHVA